MVVKRNKAVYLEQEIKEYKGTPFIEAMPSILSSKEVVEKLATYPYFNEEERICEKHIRLHIIQRVFQFFQPLPKHEKMLNFFVTLINTVSVPVILVGIPKALPIFQSEFRQARRSCGQGNMFWDRLEKDEEFLILLEELWEYQWIRKPQKLTKEIVDTIYEESQGIIDIIIKLFFMAQIRAISSGKEMITVKLIKEVADENLKILRPMLKALKSGNIKDIANYPDIIPIDITKVIQEEKDSDKLTRVVIDMISNKKFNNETKINYTLYHILMKLYIVLYQDIKYGVVIQIQKNY